MSDAFAIAATGLIISSLLLIVVTHLAPPHFLAAKSSPRSNHQSHARQLGGLAVVPALAAAIIVSTWTGTIGLPTGIWLVLGAIILFATGLIDDARELAVVPKFLLQTVAAVVVVAGLFESLEPIAPLPPLVTGGVIVLVVIWATNLTNFMDGIDLMVVAGIGVPATILGLSGFLGLIAFDVPTVLALALAAALLPFAAANRPPASIFLGDNGSLPVGLIAGTIGVGLAVKYSVAAGALPFAYFIVDTGLTLVERTLAGKNIFSAHSEHAYQIARRSGLSATNIAVQVALVSSVTTGISVLICANVIGSALGMVSGYAIALVLFASLKWKH